MPLNLELMSTFRRATLRAASAGLAVASVFLLATCDLSTLTQPSGSTTGSGSVFDSTELTISGGKAVTLGGTVTMSVISSSVSLANVIKRYHSASPGVITVDSITGLMTGVALGTAKLTARILAPELGEGVTISQVDTVRYKGIKVTAPLATDSIQGLGQSRPVTVFGLNNSNAQVGAALSADSIRSRDTTVVRASGATVIARKNGTAYVVAFFSGLRDSVAVRVRQVAKSITFPTTDYTARHVNFNLTVPLTVKDVADSIIPAPSISWATKDTTKAVIGATSGLLKVKGVGITDSVFATVDTIKRGQKIIVAQVAGSLSKFQGDARSDTVAKNVTVVPTVTVLDSGLTPIVGTSVKFKTGLGFNALVVDTLPVTTDAQGRASPTSWKLGDVAGTNNNTLIATSGAQSTTFTVSGVAGQPKKLGFVVQPTSVFVGSSITPAIQVQIQDSLGNLVSTGTQPVITLSLSNNPGAANLGGTLSVQAVAGVASFSGISLDAAGSGYALQAGSGILQVGISNAFDVFGAPTKLGFTTQPSTSTEGTTMPTVRVTVQDAGGNKVATASDSVTMAIAANPPGNGALSGTLKAAAVAGVATFSNLSINKAGSGYSMTASAPGRTPATSNTFTVAAVGPANRLAFGVQPSNVTSGSPINPQFTVLIQDAAGATVTTSSAQVTLAIDPATGSGTVSGTPTVTAINGVATFSNIIVNKATVGYKLIATSPTLQSATSAAFNVTAGTPNKLAFFQPPTHTVAGATISPAVVVEVQDANGNRSTAGAVAISLSLTSCTGTLTGGGSATTANGIATYSNLSVAAPASNCTLTVSTTAGLTSAGSSTFNVVTATGAVKLKFTTQPTSSTAGVALNAGVVAFQDASGNNATAPALTSVTIAIASGATTQFSNGTTSQAQSGTTTVSFPSATINIAGPYKLVATANGYDPDTSATFTITPAAANKVGFITQPTSVTAGVPFSTPVSVAVQDGFGNTVTGATNTINVTGAIQVSPFTQTVWNNNTTTISAVASNGIATFTGAAVRLAGTLKLNATSPTLNGGSSNLFDVKAAPLSKLGFVVQPPASPSTVAIALAPAIQVAGEDSVNNLVNDYTGNVTVALTGGPVGGATLTGTKTQPAVAGIASFNDLSVDRVGTGYQLSASASDATTANSNNFQIDPFFLAPCCTSFNDMVLVGSTIYFVGGNTLKSIPAGGGTATTITGTTNANKIATDGTDIYWAEQGTNNNGDAFIKKYTVSSGIVSTLTVGLTGLINDFSSKIYSDGINVYFIARNAGNNGQGIRSVSVNATSATPTDLFANAGNFSAPQFMVSGGLIYFYDPGLGAIRRMTTAAGSLTTLSSGAVSGQRFAIDGTTLYFNDGVVLKSIPNANTAGSAVAPTVAATATGTVYEVAADGGFLYINTDGVLRRYSTADFSVVKDLVGSNTGQAYYPFVFDGSSVYYFTGFFSRFARVPK